MADSAAKNLAQACAAAQWHDCETGESATWSDFLPIVVSPLREGRLLRKRLEASLEALEAWAIWWNALPVDSQCEKHELAHRAITLTRAAIRGAREAEGREVERG